VTKLRNRDLSLDGLFVSILALLPIIFLSPCLFGDGAFLAGDQLTLHLPLRTMLLSSWESGNVPAWNPYLFGGFPFAADPHVTAFYPPHRLLAFVTDSPARHLSWALALHLSLAATGAYVFLRRECSAWGALSGALVWGLSGFLLSHTVHPGLVAALAWTGWAAYALDRSRSSEIWGVVLAGFVALSAVAGNPHGTLLMLMCLAMLALVYLARYRFQVSGSRFQVPGSNPERRTRQLRAVPWIALLVGCGVLAFGLASVQVFPALELTLNSFRAGSDWQPPSGPTWSLLPRLFVPSMHGFGAAYTGPATFEETTHFVGFAAPAVVLAGMPFLARKRRIGLLVAFVLTLWMALGVLGAGELVPRGLRIHERFFALFVAVLTVATAWSVDALREHLSSTERNGPPLWLLAIVPVVAVGVGLLIDAIDRRELWIGVGAALLVAGALWYRRPRLVGVIIGIELLAFAGRFVHPVSIEETEQNLADIASTLSPGQRFAIVGDQAEPWLNVGTAIERVGVGGRHPLSPARQHRLCESLSIDSCHPGIVSFGSGLSEEAANSFGISSVVRLSVAGNAIRHLPTQPAVLHEDCVTAGMGYTCTPGEGRSLPATWRSCGDDCFQALVDYAPPGAILSVPLPFYPGWEATSVGVFLPIVEVNVAFSGVGVFPGTKMVEFRYSSAPTELGRSFSLASLLIMALLVVVEALQAFRRSRTVDRVRE
jgi:hypothetical protein